MPPASPTIEPVARIRELDRADVVFVGGSLPACHLAVSLAAKGLRVLVACDGASPTPEITSTLRTWVDPAPLRSVSSPVGRVVLDALHRRSASGREGLLHLARLAEGLEDLLLNAGVRFFYQAHPVGIAVGAGKVGGAVVAGKFGVGLIAAPLVVDCTESAVLLRAGRAPLMSRSRPGEPIEFTQVVQHLGEEVSRDFSAVPAVAGVHGPFVEYRFQTTCAPEDAFFAPKVVVHARRALISDGSGRPLHPLRCGDLPLLPPLWRLEAPITGDPMSLISVPGLQGFLVIGGASAVENDVASELVLGPGRALQFAGDLESLVGRLALSLKGSGSTMLRLRVAAAGGASSIPPEALRLDDPAFREPGVPVRDIEASPLPVVASADTVICGGGTSGVTAAVESARSDVDTLCLEAYGDLGGVNTVGGVPHYWFGRWSRYMIRHYLELKRLAAGRGVPWSVALLALVEGAGARVLPLTPIVGVAMRDRIVTGVVVATAAGLAVIAGKRFVDATGDGDVAAWAGVRYTYGAERDEITLWCSFGKFRSDRRAASRLYTSVVDQRSLRDATRAIIAARRQVGVFGEGEFPQFAMATRESRHIRGRNRLGYVATIAGRAHADTILVVRSNVDIKGMASSDAAMSGFVERDFLRNWKCRVPYGSLVPEDLDNVLVIGKAYSASHDALAMARMQADVAQMGAAAGAAAALASETGAAFGDLDVSRLQRMATERGLLHPEDLAAPEAPAPSDPDLLESLADRLLVGPLELDDQMSLLEGGRKSVPFLLAALEAPSGSGPPLAVARCLCLLGDRRGAVLLLPALREALEAEELPGLGSAPRHEMPDHGWAPDPVYLINALALAGEVDLIPLLGRLVDRLPIDTNLTDHRFNYVHSVAYALEHLAHPSGVPVLEALSSRPALRNRELPADADPRRSADHAAERCAYLELCLARALARCGSPRGYETLVRYLGDQRLYLARSALLELQDVAGRDFAFDAEAWMRWLDANKSSLRTAPYRRRLD